MFKLIVVLSAVLLTGCSDWGVLGTSPKDNHPERMKYVNATVTSINCFSMELTEPKVDSVTNPSIYCTVVTKLEDSSPRTLLLPQWRVQSTAEQVTLVWSPDTPGWVVVDRIKE